MLLDVRNQGLKLTRASRRHIERKVRQVLQAFEAELQRVTLIVIREARQGRNVRYRCDMVLRAHGRVPLHVVERDATVYGVCSKAIRSAGMTLLRAFTHEDDASRLLPSSI